MKKQELFHPAISVDTHGVCQVFEFMKQDKKGYYYYFRFVLFLLKWMKPRHTTDELIFHIPLSIIAGLFNGYFFTIILST